MQRNSSSWLKPYINYAEETKTVTTNSISLFEHFLDDKDSGKKIEKLTMIGVEITDLSRLQDQCAEQHISKLTLKGCKIKNDVIFDSVSPLTTLVIEECTFVLDDTQHIEAYVKSFSELEKAKNVEKATQQQISNLKLVIQNQTNDITHQNIELEVIKAVIEAKKTGKLINFGDPEKQTLFADLLLRDHTLAEFENSYTAKSAAMMEMKRYLEFYEIQLAEQKNSLKSCSLKTASAYAALQKASDKLKADMHAVFSSVGNMCALQELSVTNSKVNIIDKQEELASSSVVGDESIECFVENSLFSGQALIALDVSNNHLSCRSAYEIARLFTLEHLNISGNDIGDVGFKAFSKQDAGVCNSATTQFQFDEENAVVERLPYLTQLDANNIGITNNALVDFKKAKLQVLNIEGNDDVTIVSNQLFLSQCPALREVNTSDSANQVAILESEKQLDEMLEDIEVGAVLFDIEEELALEKASQEVTEQPKNKPTTEQSSITLVTSTLFVKTIEIADLAKFGIVTDAHVHNQAKKH